MSAAVKPPANYSLLVQCNRECHSECMAIKKFVPVSIVVGCTRGRCGCFYDIQRPISDQIINQTVNKSETVEEAQNVAQVIIVNETSIDTIVTIVEADVITSIIQENSTLSAIEVIQEAQP